MDRVIFLVDMQSFYANVEKVFQPELENKPVVVAGNPDIRNGVILAACPLAKQWGVKTTETLWEAENKCPYLVVAKPRMQVYINASVEIAAVLEMFSDAVEPYSIDEIFVEMTHSLKPFHGDPQKAAVRIKRHIQRMLGVHARIGIGPTKVLAKMACDHFAKQSSAGVFTLSQDNISEQLWPRSIDHLFGVGRQMERHLRNMGIRTIGQLARFPLEPLKKRWGINGELLWRTSHGWDPSPVTADTHIRRKGIGHHMTLPRDYYSWKEIRVVLRELSEEVARRARKNGCTGKVISAEASSRNVQVPAKFHRQVSLDHDTNDGKVIYDAAARLFHHHWDGYPVRSIGVTLHQLTNDTFRQLSLFHPLQEREALHQTIDDIEDRFGSGTILYASSLTAASQAHLRAQKIGGHYK
ncbi:DNA polymerase-4/DNA polymerase V [Alteribacillus persepolensis]|uniref:DNA polymerase IV n=1 Tax=Alteribacillus persepolensis TaxID=568899 RepID=A0A1G8ES24_9BACI|nr:DNA polymerase IV [Alteribacillus persepolensis]SDH72676.1 DNA polymerase-4/DNA polymerase V [Alteribacillus persepolensis]